MRAETFHTSRGFSLIEALIALLVLSIGMLGAAAMQLNALQGAHMAYQRSIATLAAQDAQERLWAQMAEEGGSCPSPAAAMQLGEIDWDAAWSGYLPGFSGQSSVSDKDDCAFEITIGWDEGRVEEGQEAFTYRVRLPGETNDQE